ncbi:MAG: flagellar biosynthesis protein FlhF [Planctomycetales bacterium]
MSSDVRTFKAANMQEALQIVRQEMGPDAVILHTRELPASRLLGLFKNKERVEITAGLGINVSTEKVVRSKAENSDEGGVEVAIARTATKVPPKPAIPESINRRQLDSDLAEPPNLLPGGTEARRPAVPRRPAPLPERQTTPPKPAPKRIEEDYTLESVIPRIVPPPRAPRTAPVPHPTGGRKSENTAAITEQLNSIRNLVERLNRQTGKPGSGLEVPQENAPLANTLKEAGVDDTLISELLTEVGIATENGPHLLARSRESLRKILERDLPCSGPIAVEPGRCRTVALVGPTGVGKTTTIAKLAAHYALCKGVRTALVTVDTYRIAAVEQLKTYAEIIDLPMKVVTTPEEMQNARDSFDDHDLILIDTAGRSPRDEDRIQELVTLLQAADVDETHLVLSLVSSVRTLEHAIERFAPTRMSSLILSKLDEARELGSILNLTRKHSLPISYLTTGQDVPDDFEIAEPPSLAKLILGENRIQKSISRAA